MTEKDTANDKGGFGYPLLGDVRRHGEGFCQKVVHSKTGGYLHHKDDDTIYFVDGVAYCGRCHMYLDRFSD
jgi:hypothetical protein